MLLLHLAQEQNKKWNEEGSKLWTAVGKKRKGNNINGLMFKMGRQPIRVRQDSAPSLSLSWKSLHSKTIMAVKYLPQHLSPIFNCQLKWVVEKTRFSSVHSTIAQQSFGWKWKKICAQWKNLLQALSFLCVLCYLHCCCAVSITIILLHECIAISKRKVPFCAKNCCTTGFFDGNRQKPLLSGKTCSTPPQPCVHCGICIVVVLLQLQSHHHISALQLWHSLDIKR